MLSTLDVLKALPVLALIILATRAVPFILFSRHNPPKLLQFIERFIPPMIMAVLVIYCFKDVPLSSPKALTANLAAATLVVILHLWKKNAMLSIFTGTAFFMIVSHILL